MTYLLRDVPDELWKEVKKKCIDKEIKIKEIIIVLLQDWINDDDKKKGGRR